MMIIDSKVDYYTRRKEKKGREIAEPRMHFSYIASSAACFFFAQRRRTVTSAENFKLL